MVYSYIIMNLLKRACSVHVLAFAALIVTLVAPAVTHAQSTQVYLSNVQLERSHYVAGDTVHGTFDVENFSETATPEIEYLVSLVGLDDSGHVARIVYGTTRLPAVTLAAKTKDVVPFQYDLAHAPKDSRLAIHVRAILHDGLSLSWSLTPLTVTGGVASAQPVGASVIVNGTQYGLQEGPTVHSGDDVQLSALFQSSGADIAVTPHFILTDKSGIPLTDTTELVMDPTRITSSTSTITVKIPYEHLSPGTYLGKLTLLDTKSVARAPELYARFIVAGDTASIVAVYGGVEKEGTVPIRVAYTGTPIDIDKLGKTQDINKAAASISVTARVDVLTDEGVVLGTSVTSQSLATQGSFTVPVPLVSAGEGTRARVTLSQQNRTLDTFEGPIISVLTADAPVVGAPLHISAGVLIAVLIAAAGIALVSSAIFWVKKKRRASVLAVIIAIISLFGLVWAPHHLTAEVMGLPDFINIGGGPPPTVVPGQRFSVNTTYMEAACVNSYTYAIGTTEFVGQRYTSGQVGVSGFGSNIMNYYYYYSGYNDMWLGDYTAPSSGGTYNFNLTLKSYSAHYGYAGQVTKVWPVTVVAASCALPWGGSIADGQSVTAYQSNLATDGASCVSENRTCHNGTLSGSYTNPSCTVVPATSCKLPWGGYIADGETVIAYESANGSPSCTLEVRACRSGTLTGSFQYQQCRPAGGTSGGGGGASCTLPWGGSIRDGEKIVMYSSPVSSTGRSCSGGAFERECVNGSLSGLDMYQYPSCICSSGYFCSGDAIWYMNADCSVSAKTTCTSREKCVAGASSCVIRPLEFEPFSSTLTGHLQAIPVLVRKGSPTTIYWNLTGAASCLITGTNGDSWTGASSGSAGLKTSAISQQTSYTLLCTGYDGTSVRNDVMVNVAPVYDEH